MSVRTHTVGSAISSRSKRLIGALSCAVFLTVFGLSALNNDFPFEYHPDEPSKVAQVLSGERNYHHPALMLTLTAAALHVAHVDPRPQNVARVGRYLSAVYMAGAAAFLTALAGIYGGSLGAAGTGTVLGTNWQVILAGHFFKEDSLFTLGLAATCFCGALYWRRRNLADAALLGLAAGLTFSSKYIGMIAVLYAFALVTLAAWPKDVRRSWSALGACAAAVLGIILICNGSALFFHFTELRQGIALGLNVARHGNQSIGSQVPHAQFIGMFFLTPFPVLAGAMVFWWDLRQHPLRSHADRWLLGLAPLGLLAIFSFSVSTAVRYFLPISVLFGCMAGASLPICLRWIASPRLEHLTHGQARLLILAGLSLILIFNLPGLISLLNSFAHDDRVELCAWIRNHLPASALIAQDRLAQLGGANVLPELALVPRVLSKPSVADFGDLAQLRAQGITHVVVCWYDSRRYVEPRKRPSTQTAADFQRHRQFYVDLPTQDRLLWRSELRQPYPLCPGLSLYELSP